MSSHPYTQSSNERCSFQLKPSREVYLRQNKERLVQLHVAELWAGSWGCKRGVGSLQGWGASPLRSASVRPRRGRAVATPGALPRGRLQLGRELYFQHRMPAPRAAERMKK